MCPCQDRGGGGAVWAEIRVVVSDADYRRKGAICTCYRLAAGTTISETVFSASYGTVLLIQYSGTRMRAR